MRWIVATLAVAILAVPGATAAFAAEEKFGPARSRLLRGLKSKSVAERTTAVYEVDGFDSAEAARALVRFVLAREDRARVIRAGVQLAGALKSPAAVAALVAEAKKGNWRTRARVLESLATVEGDEALGALLIAAYDQDLRVRISAILAMEHRRDEPAIVAVLDGLKAKEWAVRSASIYVLGRMKAKDAVVPLIRRLGADGEDGRLLVDAARSLRKIAGKDFGLDGRRWTDWYVAERGREALDLGPYRKPPEPSVRLAGVTSTAKRVVFVLGVNDTMNREVQIPPDRAAPADVRKAGGAELKRWLAVKTKMDLARVWIAWSIDRLAPETEFNIVTIGVSTNAVFSDFLPATPSNREKAKKRVLSLSASGNANLYDGLRRIFTLTSKDPVDPVALVDGPEEVWFLGDGAADEGMIKSAFEAFEEAERWNRYRQIRFNCFGVGEHDPRALADLAGMIPDGAFLSLP